MAFVPVLGNPFGGAGTPSTQGGQWEPVDHDPFAGPGDNTIIPYARGQLPDGMSEGPNVELWNRPPLQNEDGTFSTTSSYSDELERGTEVVYPSVVDGKRLTRPQAIEHYALTGENLGKFPDPNPNTRRFQANQYAEQLHRQQEAFLKRQQGPGNWEPVNHDPFAVSSPSGPNSLQSIYGSSAHSYFPNIALGAAQKGAQSIIGGSLRLAVGAGDAVEDWVDANLRPYAPDVADFLHGTPAQREKNRAERQKIAASIENINLGYQEGTSWEDVKRAPISNIIPFAVEQGLTSIPDMIAVMRSLPGYALARTGVLGQERAKNDERANATLGDFVKAAPAAVASALLERLGTEKLLGVDEVVKGLREIPKAALKATVTEAATEAAQEAVEYTGETLGTKTGFAPLQAAERALAGAAGGGPFGGAVRTLTGTVQAIANSPGRYEAPEGQQTDVPTTLPEYKPGEMGALIAEEKKKLDALKHEAINRGLAFPETATYDDMLALFAERDGMGLDQAIGTDPTKVETALNNYEGEVNAAIATAVPGFSDELFPRPQYGQERGTAPSNAEVPQGSQAQGAGTQVTPQPNQGPEAGGQGPQANVPGLDGQPVQQGGGEPSSLTGLYTHPGDRFMPEDQPFYRPGEEGIRPTKVEAGRVAEEGQEDVRAAESGAIRGVGRKPVTVDQVIDEIFPKGPERAWLLPMIEDMKRGWEAHANGEPRPEGNASFGWDTRKARAGGKPSATPKRMAPKKGGKKIGLSWDKERVVKIFGEKMYEVELSQVTVKEMLQNAFDAVKAAYNNKTISRHNGRIEITVDPDDRTITMRDNGAGMTPQIVEEAFLRLAGTDKTDLAANESSGGFGIAKLAFILGNDGLRLETVRNGVKTIMDTNPAEIMAEQVELQTFKTTEPPGTTITVKMPKERPGKDGEMKEVHLPYGWESVDVLKKPLIGDVDVVWRRTRTNWRGVKEVEEETVPIGRSQPLPPLVTQVKTSWGRINVFLEPYEPDSTSMKIRTGWGPQHFVLSSGVYQFMSDVVIPGEYRAVPYNIIFDVKSDAAPTDRNYPFNNQREAWSNKVAEDIDALNFLILRKYRAENARELVGNMVDAEQMPVTRETSASGIAEVNFEPTGLRKHLPAAARGDNFQIEKEITIKNGKTYLGHNQQPTEDSEDKFDPKAFTIPASEVPSDRPYFHSNLNIDIIARTAEKAGVMLDEVNHFFAALGTIALDYRSALANVDGYSKWGQKGHVVGISLDKTYHGVHIRVPYQGFFFNPLSTKLETLNAIARDYTHSLMHEATHTHQSGHYESFTTELANVEGRFEEKNPGLRMMFERRIIQVLSKNKRILDAAREIYNDPGTKNAIKDQPGVKGKIGVGEQRATGLPKRTPGSRQEQPGDVPGELQSGDRSDAGQGTQGGLVRGPAGQEGITLSLDSGQSEGYGDGYYGTDHYTISDNGRPIGDIGVKYQPDLRTIYVYWVGTPQANPDSYRIGPTKVRQLLSQLKTRYPQATHISGERITGARVSDPKVVTQPLFPPKRMPIGQAMGPAEEFEKAQTSYRNRQEAYLRGYEDLATGMMIKPAHTLFKGAVKDANIRRLQSFIQKVNNEIRRLAPLAHIRVADALIDVDTMDNFGGVTFRQRDRGGIKQIVSWALTLDENTNAWDVAWHEVIHALKQSGLFTPTEWESLRQAAYDGNWIGIYRIRERWAHLNLNENDLIEEAIAERFKDWMGDRSLFVSKDAKPLFQRLAQLVKRLLAVIKETFGNNLTADEVFDLIDAGWVGRRPEGRWEEPYGTTPKRVVGPSNRTVRPTPGRPTTGGLGPQAGAGISVTVTQPQSTLLNWPRRKFEQIMGETAEKYGDKLHDALNKYMPKSIDDFIYEGQNLLTPMATGTPRTRSIAKDFANALRKIRYNWTVMDAGLKVAFNRQQRKAMWEAADEESVLRQQGIVPGANQGLNRLTAEERLAVEQLQQVAENLFQRAQALGMTHALGLPSYTPRMFVRVSRAAGGAIESVSRWGRGETVEKFTSDLGRNVQTTTPQLLHRKHLTAQESTQAAQAKGGADIEIVPDIRALAVAAGRLEQAIAGRELIERIKELGKQVGIAMTAPGTTHDPKIWFTIDHPSFRQVRPKFIKEQATGKIIPARDQNGTIQWQNEQIYVLREFEGPLRAVLSKQSGYFYNALMNLKGRMMAVIMFSPLIHGAVIWGKAVPAAPVQLGAGLARGALRAITFGQIDGGTFLASRSIYMIGAGVISDKALMEEALNNGVDPIGKRYFNQDITSIMEEQEGKHLLPGRSWTANVIAFIPGLLDKGASDKIKEKIDEWGDVWHNKFLWDQVFKLQMGLYKVVKENEMKKGLDADSAGKVAAHFANRYAGSLPIESMSQLARQVANTLLFSRSFTLSNLGAFKDLVNGLPRDLQAQILERSGKAQLNRAQGVARRKAMGMLAIDIMLSMAGLWLGAYTAMFLYGLVSGDDDREFVKPGSFGMFGESDNEPGKENRFFIGYQADGTALYARLPTGKVGEELVEWILAPRDELLRKLSPFSRFGYGIMANDNGFGQKLYDPTDKSPTGWARTMWVIMGQVVDSIVPMPMIEGWYGLATGTSDDATRDVLRSTLPLAGVTISRGAPGGPGVGELYSARTANEFQVQQAMPGIRDLIRDNRMDEARARMNELNISPPLQNYHIMTTRYPGMRLSPRALREFRGYATPEQQERMNRALERQRQFREANP